MANEVSLFESSALPAHLQGIQLDDDTKALAGGGGGLRISIKGGVFRMLENGEELARRDERAMNVIIVASSHDTARTYYEGAYVEGESSAPICWSADGITPDPSSSAPQASKCTLCPQNIKGSGENGGRACRYSRRLAIVFENDIGGKIFKLDLPSMSIFGKPENGVVPIQAYATSLVQKKVPISAVVTELRFDTSAAVPKLGFKAIRFLTAEEFALAQQASDSPEALEAITLTAFAADNAHAPAAADKFSQDAPAVKTDPVVIHHPATVPAAEVAAPKRRRRTAAEMAAAADAEAVPAAAVVPDSPIAPAVPTPAELLAAKMAELKAQMDALSAGAAVQGEPTIVTKPAAPTPPANVSSIAAALEEWDE